MLWLWIGKAAWGLDSTAALNESSQTASSLMEQPFTIGVDPKTFVSFGGTSGLSLASEHGIFTGVEASIARVNGNRSIGINGDVLWDTVLQGASISVGPRFGVLMFALDGGVGLRTDFDAGVELGSYIRTSLNLGFVSTHYRFGLWPEADELATVHQLGVSLRFPQQLGYAPRTVQE